jgi:hypothetical protein
MHLGGSLPNQFNISIFIINNREGKSGAERGVNNAVDTNTG